MNKRRAFINKISLGSMGVFAIPGMLEAILTSCSNNHGADKNVFPFYDFAKRFDIGDYIPKDQGGKFVQMELLRTESDQEIVAKINNGALEKIYGDPIGWEALEKNELEKSVWLNRFYFLPSFARMYYLTKEKGHVVKMVSYLKRWIIDNPYIKGESDKTYNWRDMQVAWRAINWSWCYYLTKDQLLPEQNSLLVNSLKKHGEILLSDFGEQPLNEFNHQSHGALAMLYLGVLFPDWEISKALRDKAWVILEHHLNKAFFKDGGNVEMMFGYYPFEAQIFRDALLLSKHNNIPIPQNLIITLNKMADYIAFISQPDHTMPPINDSYPMPTSSILETLGDVEGIKVPTNDNIFHLFSDSQIGVLNKSKEGNPWYWLAYPAKSIGSHAHAGRLSLVLWKNKRPIFIESGCCNYDNPLLVEWFRTSQAHNTVLIDGKGDPETSSSRLWVKKRITENKIIEWKQEKRFEFCQMFSPSTDPANFGVNWYRSLTLLNEKLFIVHDYFDTDKAHDYELLFHFPQIPVSKKDKDLFIYEDDAQRFVPANQKSIKDLNLEKGIISNNGKPVEAPMAKYLIEGEGATHSILLLFSENEFGENLQIDQKTYPKGVTLSIESSLGKWMLLLKNPSSEILKVDGYKTDQAIAFWEL